MIEHRITRADGRAYAAEGDNDQAVAVLSRGRKLLAEARATYGLGSRDAFRAGRLRDGTVVISGVRRAKPLPAADELAEARQRLLEVKATALPGGPR